MPPNRRSDASEPEVAAPEPEAKASEPEAKVSEPEPVAEAPKSTALKAPTKLSATAKTFTFNPGAKSFAPPSFTPPTAPAQPSQQMPSQQPPAQPQFFPNGAMMNMMPMNMVVPQQGFMGMQQAPNMQQLMQRQAVINQNMQQNQASQQQLQQLVQNTQAQEGGGEQLQVRRGRERRRRERE